MLELPEYFSEHFSQLDCSAQQISNKTFECCTFESCDFSEAIFKACIFDDCQFIKCNLSVIKIGYSKFNEVTFEDCKLIGIDWTQGHWSNLALGSPISFKQSVINTSSFYGLDLKSISIETCQARDVDFRHADMSNANFTYTDLSNSLFDHTNLTEANFCEATNYNIDVNRNEVKKATFCKFEALRLLESLGIELVD